MLRTLSFVVALTLSAGSAAANQWIDLQPATNPGHKDGLMLAYDASSGLVVLFGNHGSIDISYEETWAYDVAANSWAEKTPATFPIPRAHGAMVYDCESDLVVLYGGTPDDNTLPKLGDTWIYDVDADVWQEVSPPVSPGPKWVHQMVYDSQSDRVILYGGSWLEDETWAYDTNTNVWEHMAPAQTPGGMHLHAMSYDSAVDRVIAAGGGETWAYDYESDTWELLNQDAPPGLGGGAQPMMVYDAESALHFLLNDDGITWSFDYATNAWSDMMPSGPTPNVHHHHMTYVPDADRVILYANRTAQESPNETYAYEHDGPGDPIVSRCGQAMGTGGGSAGAGGAAAGGGPGGGGAANGGSGPIGAGGSSEPSGGSAATPEAGEEGGCGCRVAAPPARGLGIVVVIAGALLALARRYTGKVRRPLVLAVLVAPMACSVEHLMSGPGATSGAGAAAPCDAPPAEPVIMADDQDAAYDVVVDGGRVFWTAEAAGMVMAADLDGSNPVALATGFARPRGIAVGGDFVYFTDFDQGTVNRVPRGGGEPESIVVGQIGAHGITVDGDAVYWARELDRTVDGGIWTAPLTGGDPTRLVDDVDRPERVAGDALYVYFTSSAFHRVGKVRKTGGNSETVASGPDAEKAYDVAVDEEAVCWTGHIEQGQVRCYPLPGGPVQQISAEAGWHTGIALDADAVYFVRGSGSYTLVRQPRDLGPPETLASDLGQGEGLAVGCSSAYLALQDLGRVVRVATH
jgi:galactose oxidase-like protein